MPFVVNFFGSRLIALQGGFGDNIIHTADYQVARLWQVKIKKRYLPAGAFGVRKRFLGVSRVLFPQGLVMPVARLKIPHTSRCHSAGVDTRKRSRSNLIPSKFLTKIC